MKLFSWILVFGLVAVSASEVSAYTQIPLGNGASFGFGHHIPGADIDWEYKTDGSAVSETVEFEVEARCSNCLNCTNCGVEKFCITWTILDASSQPVVTASRCPTAHMPNTCVPYWKTAVSQTVNWAAYPSNAGPSAGILLVVTVKCKCCDGSASFAEMDSTEVIEPRVY